MATGAEAIDQIASAVELPRVTVARAARALREAKRDLWPQALPGGGKNANHVRPHHLNNLIFALMCADPISQAPFLVQRYLELVPVEYAPASPRQRSRKSGGAGEGIVRGSGGDHQSAIRLPHPPDTIYTDAPYAAEYARASSLFSEDRPTRSKRLAVLSLRAAALMRSSPTLGAEMTRLIERFTAADASVGVHSAAADDLLLGLHMAGSAPPSATLHGRDCSGKSWERKYVSLQHLFPERSSKTPGLYKAAWITAKPIIAAADLWRDTLRRSKATAQHESSDEQRAAGR